MKGIQKKSVKILHQAHRQSKASNIEKRQNEIVNVIEQLSDTALNSTSQEDRNMSLIAVNRLRDLLIYYQSIKPSLPPIWFKVSSDHFINISEEFYNEILERKIWLDSMIFMNMEGIFKTSFRTMADTTNAVAYNTRKIGVAALENKQDEGVHLTIEYFNTFLRLALNEKNQRIIFNLFYQYRLVAEAQAFIGKVKNFGDLLKVFLSFDDVFGNQSHPIAKAGIRKAQLIFAAYLFSHKAAPSNISQKTLATIFFVPRSYIQNLSPYR